MEECKPYVEEYKPYVEECLPALEGAVSESFLVAVTAATKQKLEQKECPRDDSNEEPPSESEHNKRRYNKNRDNNNLSRSRGERSLFNQKHNEARKTMLV